MTPLEINKKIAEIKELKMDEAPNLGQSALVFVGADNHESESYKDWAKDIKNALELFEEMNSFYASSKLYSGDRVLEVSDFILSLEHHPNGWAFSIIEQTGDCFGGFNDKTLIYIKEVKYPSEAICLAWIKWKER